MSGNHVNADESGMSVRSGRTWIWAGKETWDQLHNLWHDGRELQLCVLHVG